MLHTYRAPQTQDGSITDVSTDARGQMLIEVRFEVPREFCESGQISHAQFACRSRIARLGIDIRPIDGIQVEQTTASLRASVHAVVPQYGVRELLPDVILPGVHVGRLVMCDPQRRLSSMELYNEYSANAFKLPAGFSIDAEGQFTIRPHKLIYDLERTPSVDDLFAILNRPDGKSLLNRLQVARPVDNILLEPGQGVITSCTMFLHRHYVVLESDPTALGRHMHAVVLDPVTTRGPRVFLEFYNDSDTAIVNPASTGVVYLAEKIHTKRVTWAGTINGSEHIGSSAAISEYAQIENLFRGAESSEDSQLYFDRAAAVIPGPVTDFHLSGPLEWTYPEVAETASVTLRSAQDRVVTETSCVRSFGTRALNSLPNDSQGTILLRHFPNLAEHLELASAASKRKINRLVFEKASFEHGPFLSARDHARLVDYADLGVEVLWCNDVREHLAVHVFRGHRGFFCEIDAVDKFKSALVVAVYGSSRRLSSEEANRLSGLIHALSEFFGEDLAILTGGGPGAMQEASQAAKKSDLLVGASYLEIEDQQTNQLADFYQVFQENCRHSRQRWFEIAGFHVFCVGGVGTLEEIGVTLTDIKLGIADGTPLIFFGRSAQGLYWDALVQQLERIVDEERGPSWLRTHVLVTDDPHEVISFYKQKLDLG